MAFLDEKGFRLEIQNFRPPEEKERSFSIVGGVDGTEVGLLSLESGKVKNCPNAPGRYDEQEGLFPDGKYTLMECAAHNFRGGHAWSLFKNRCAIC